MVLQVSSPCWSWCWVHTAGLRAFNARINAACRGEDGCWGALWDRWVLSYCSAWPLIFRELCFPRKVNTSRLLSLISPPLLLQLHQGSCSPERGRTWGGGGDGSQRFRRQEEMEEIKAKFLEKEKGEGVWWGGGLESRQKVEY